MPTFHSKPVIIEAEQFFPNKPLPFHWKGPYVTFENGQFYVTTAHGLSAGLRPGDWVVLEPTGPHTPSLAAYPVRDDIFHSRWQAEALLVSRPPAGDWQPIETVPKDGTPLLIWADGSHLIHLFWKNDHWEWLGGGRCADGQYRMTHWMPLPAPPAALPLD